MGQKLLELFKPRVSLLLNMKIARFCISYNYFFSRNERGDWARSVTREL